MRDNTQVNNDISIDDMLNPDLSPVIPKAEEVIPPTVPPAPAVPPVNTNDTNDKPDAKTLLSSFSGDVESEDNKALRDDLLKEYKGASFDNQGNILDASGNIVKGVDALLLDMADENEATLDAEGNEIDDEGKIIKTKEELAKDAKAKTPIVNEILQDLEYDFLDEAGLPKTYTDDKEGVKALAVDYATAMFNEAKDKFIENNKEAIEIAKHMALGNTIDTYNSSVDYSKIKVEDLSNDQLNKYIRQSYKLSNFSDERIDSMLELFKDGNRLKEEGKHALLALTKNDADTKTNREAAYQQQLIEDNNKQEQYWGGIKNTIAKGDIGIANIPKKDQEGFYNYMAMAVDKNGNSKEMTDRNNETLEQKVALAYFRYKGFDLNQLVTNKAQTMKSISLKQRMQDAAKINYSSSSPNKKASGKIATSDDVSIDDMLS
jgi:hypothetical protein